MEWLTVTEAAEVLGVSAATLRRWDRSGKLPAVRHPVSGYRMYLRAQLEGAQPVADPGPALLGRSQERAALDALLEQARLVTITGPPGIGKTRLLADAVARHPGAVQVDCDEVATVEGFVRATARAVGVPPARLEHRLGAGALLLGLDNLEQLLDVGVPELVASWLERAPSLRVVATSRELLRLGPERPLRLGPLERAAGVRLFARAGVEGWSEDAVAEVVERLEGNPLAIELAASQASLLGPRELLAQLGPGLLVDDRRDAPPRHASLEQAVRSSLARLEPDVQEALRQLLVFRGGFTVAAARAVLTVADPLGALRSLQAASLLRTWPEDGARRHAPWVVVREVLAAAETAPEHHLAERHARWLVASLPAVRTGESAELGNLEVALGRTELPASLRAEVLVASWALIRQLPIAERVRQVTALLPQEPGLEARLRLVRAAARVEQSRLDEAIADLEQALVDAEDPRTRAHALLDLAMARMRTDPDDVPDLDEVVAAARASGDDALLGRALAVQANAHIREPRVALELLREALAVAEPDGGLALGIRCQQARLRSHLGEGAVDDALAAVALGRRLRDDRLVAYALETVSLELLDLGRIDAAVETLEEAEEVARRLGGHEQEGRAAVIRAVALLETGRIDEATAAAREAGHRFPTGTMMRDRCDAALALCVAADGDIARARRMLPEPARTWFASFVTGIVERLDGADTPTPEVKDATMRALLRIEAALQRTGLRLAPDGSWFEVPGQPRVSLAERPVLARLLRALREADGPVSSDALVAAAWPDESPVGDSGQRRVRSAIWSLRELGLRPHLRTTGHGYVLDEASPADRSRR